MSTGSSPADPPADLTAAVPAWLGGLLADAAATVPDGDSLDQALDTHLRHRSGPLAELVATLAVREAELADLAGLRAPSPTATPPGNPPTGPLDLTVVLSGGAGSQEPPVRWAAQVRRSSSSARVMAT